MSQISIVDKQFGTAYPFADEKGKPDTTSSPGCFISTTNPVGVVLSMENRKESYILQGAKVIQQDPNDRTLNLDVYFTSNNRAVGHPGNQVPSGFVYNAFYMKDGAKGAGAKDGRASREVVSTNTQGFGCLIS
ncbi:hypothetical protein EST38_g12100 [Candolleomyces aberdarensis]|uniref:Uncharacterized protein n=1 Tax=Candolleomyces aberdarensis TaxID=2316362 RepID=A0A4Q2D6F8_9AGAR|nr:hypothetical protein EST38_g12100 [Candolleomyces aberdarensis]